MISFGEVFMIALRALMVNKTRSFLTTLGIIIGVGAVIAAFAVGQGANKVIEEQIAMLGSNFMFIQNERPSVGSRVSTRYLTEADAEAIGRECSGIAAVAPSVQVSAQVIYGSANWSTSVEGSTPSYSAVGEWRIAFGRDLTQQDVRAGSKVCVLGNTVAEKLFEGEDPIGRVIRIRTVPFTVIGVFASKGQSTSGYDQDDFILAPLSTAQRRLTRNANTGRVGNIMVKGVSMKALDYLELQIKELLRERHRIRPGDPDDFRVWNISQILEARRRSTQIMSILLGAIAVISLVVGGIGIMNIMLVSVTERTREIGIRMAVGAKSSDIRMQFLIEALTLSLLGGALGVMLGMASAYGLSSVMQSPPIFGIGSIALAFIFSSLVGVGFGFYPAWRASLLNPIDALKYE
ncbi:MAG: ABC transporter permease [Synergistaceae bacterium]|jgi:putative ABC transport system permease protein|nr:ABC transporter permease [Synergistaceae bacterium]